MSKPASVSREAIAKLFIGFAGQGNTLVIPRPFVDLCKGDHLAALFLSQCLYWMDRTQDPDGWFSKSFKEWDEELAMSTFQIRRAVKALQGYGVEMKKRRSRHHSGAPTLHYRVNKTVMTNRVLDFVNGLVSFSLMEETHYSDQQETHYSYTETTAEKKELALASQDAGEGTSCLADEADDMAMFPQSKTIHKALGKLTRPAQSPSPLKEKDSKKEDTTAPIPHSGEPPSPAVETSKRSAKQLANDALVEALRAAWFTGRNLPVPDVMGKRDYGVMAKTAQELVDGGITTDCFLAYVQYWHKAAATWPNGLTLHSLTNNGRMGDFLAFKATQGRKDVVTSAAASAPIAPRQPMTREERIASLQSLKNGGES